MRVIRPIEGLIETTSVPEVVVDDIGAVNTANGLTDITWVRNQEPADRPNAGQIPMSQLRMLVPTVCLPQILAKLIVCLPKPQKEQPAQGFDPQLVE